MMFKYRHACFCVCVCVCLHIIRSTLIYFWLQFLLSTTKIPWVWKAAFFYDSNDVMAWYACYWTSFIYTFSQDLILHWTLCPWINKRLKILLNCTIGWYMCILWGQSRSLSVVSFFAPPVVTGGDTKCLLLILTSHISVWNKPLRTALGFEDNLT